MKPTDIAQPDYFHKVVDCQWACPAHTPVPEYIRLIAQGRYSDAYMVNWVSNVFPGILGRTCDRPCEPACRRGRVEENQGDKLAAERFELMKEHLAKNGVDITPMKNGAPLTLGPWLTCDPKTERFVDNKAANALLTRDYRAPYVVPKRF